MHVRQGVASFPGFTLVLRPNQTASGRQRLQDGICQTVWQRAIWQTVLCQTVWQMRRLADGRRSNARLSGR